MSIVFSSLNDKQLIQQLQDGGIGVMPTDTVYGVVCRAGDEAAVTKLYALKQRDKKPGTVIAASMDQLVQLGFKARYIHAYDNFWPNPLSIIVPSSLTYLTQGVGSLAVRVVKGPETLLELIKETGPLLTSSANQPGEPTANTVQEAQDVFGDTIDFYVNGGDLTGNKPSTVIRVIDDAIEVLRPGAVAISDSGRIS